MPVSQAPMLEKILVHISLHIIQYCKKCCEDLNLWISNKYVMLYAIWHQLYNLKNVKNTRGGKLADLEASACFFTKSNNSA